MNLITVTGRNVSEAWLGAIGGVYREPGRAAMHTVVRIEDPVAEDPRIRGEVDRLMSAVTLPPVATVANTIFPFAIAARSANHSELADKYRSMYKKLRDFPGNQRGTYFGRLVAYPSASGRTIDQVARVIHSLKEESDHRGPKTARYEAVISSPTEDIDHSAAGEESPMYSVPIYAGGVDNSVMGFPCLSHCSFQLDREGAVHALAYYRSQYMVRRAYGNYLGLGQLLGWIANEAQLSVGVLTIVSGYARVDQSILKVGSLLGEYAR